MVTDDIKYLQDDTATQNPIETCKSVTDTDSLRILLHVSTVFSSS